MPQLHETLMGERLIKSVLPDIAHQLERIANALEKKQKPDQIATAFETYINNYPNDAELGKTIRQLWQTK